MHCIPGTAPDSAQAPQVARACCRQRQQVPRRAGRAVLGRLLPLRLVVVDDAIYRTLARPPPTWWRGRQPPAGGAAGARPTGALAWRRVDGRLTLLVLSVQLSSLSLSSALEDSVTSDLEVSADDLSLLQRTLTLKSTTLRSLRAP